MLEKNQENFVRTDYVMTQIEINKTIDKLFEKIKPFWKRNDQTELTRYEKRTLITDKRTVVFERIKTLGF